MCFLFWKRKNKKVEETKANEKTLKPETKKDIPVKGEQKRETENENTTKKQSNKTEVTVKEKVEETKISESVDKKSQRKAPTSKVYHVSLRKDDGKWQVKYGGGKKAIKLFNTQAEAIKFAEERAESQDGSISIHKRDGKIRKQDYSKKSEDK